MRHPDTTLIRAATTSDAPVVAALLTELGHETRAADVAERLPAVLAAGGAVMLACVSGEPVAVMCLARFTVLHAGGSVAYITALVTTKRWQGHGIGRLLVDAAFRWAEEHNCARLSVTSAEHRAGAHAFYPRCGLPYTGRRFAAPLPRPQRA